LQNNKCKAASFPGYIGEAAAVEVDKFESGERRSIGGTIMLIDRKIARRHVASACRLGIAFLTGLFLAAAMVTAADASTPIISLSKPLFTIKETRPIEVAAFSPDGKMLVYSTGQPRIGDMKFCLNFWDLSTGKIVRRNRVNLPSEMKFSPDGTMLAILGEKITGTKREVYTSGSFLTIWDAKSARPKRSLPHCNYGYGNGIDFSADGKSLATGDTTDHGPGGVMCPKGKGKPCVIVYDVATWKAKRILKGAKYWFVHAMYSTDGGLLVAGDGESLVPSTDWQVWDANSSKAVRKVHGSSLTYPAFFLSGGRTLVIYNDFVDLGNDGAEFTSMLEWLYGSILGGPMGPNGDQVLVSKSPGKKEKPQPDSTILELWDVKSKTPIRAWRGPERLWDPKAVIGGRAPMVAVQGKSAVEVWRLE
jgi:WD40 repeat protein